MATTPPTVREVLQKHPDAILVELKRMTQASNFPAMCHIFAELSRCTSLVDPSKVDFVTSLFNDFPWSLSSQVSDAFLNFVKHLVSANGFYFSLSVKHLIGSLLKHPPIPQETILMIQNLLLFFVRTFPANQPVLLDSLVQQFPHKLAHIEIILNYLRFLFFFLSNVPVFRPKLWEIIIFKLLEFDVDIKLDDVVDSDIEDQFEVEYESCSDLDSDVDVSLNTNINPQKSSKLEASDYIKTMADKLDDVMGLCFSFIDHTFNLCTSTSEFAETLFSHMLDCYDKLLVVTHRSKFTQFLLFYAIAVSSPPAASETGNSESELSASFDSISISSSQAVTLVPNSVPNSKKRDLTLASAFVAFLVNRAVLAPDTDIISRQLSIGYLASFITRSNFLPLSLIEYVIQSFVTFAQEYENAHGLVHGDVDYSHHVLFYHVILAILYVLCFHLRMIMSTTRGIMVAQSWKLDKVIMSKLNPLKFCLDTVAVEFSKIAAELGLLDCKSIIEENQTLLVTSYDDNEPLVDSYFPFDPYLLNKSSEYIRKFYRDWAGSGDDDESSYESD
ncbi:hypothetical protein RCL1_001980 [Eukaryota sp. TZLM3-RCL]